MLRLARPAFLALALGVGLAPVGCGDSDPVTDAPSVVSPGSKSLSSDDPTCKTKADCAADEDCVGGLCQMARCGTQPYTSAPPLGKRSYFAVDRELTVLNDDPGAPTVDGYEPTSGSFAHPDALSFSFGGKIVDQAGGNFLGKRPEGIVAALAGQSSVVVATGSTQTSIPVGFAPVALAGGDVEGDGTDEIVAVSASGSVALCSAITKSCSTRTIGSLTAKDVTMADVDADGHAEAVVLGDRAGKSLVVVVNFDDAATGQEPTIEIPTGHVGQRIAAADLDQAPGAEILVLEDGGYLGLASDTLRAFGRKDGKVQELGTVDVAKDAIDVYAGDTDGDDKPEVLVLEKSGVEVFDVSGPTSLSSAYKTSLTASTTPARLAMADLDGDSPAGTLLGDAELVPGPVVPVSVLAYPPYSRTRSSGTSSLGLGSSESQSASEATTVTLNAAFGLGYQAEIPGVVRVGVSAKISASIARTNTVSRSVSVGDSFYVDARPDLEGPDNGVAVLSCACYHGYTYEIEDPAGRLGSTAANGKKLNIFVPVGGQTSLWSLKRYNVLAEKLGNLPIIRVPYKVGDPTSYPSKMETLAGKAIPEQDLLFTTPRSYRTSDVASVGWSLSVSEGKAQTDALTVGVSVSTSVTVGGFSANLDFGVSEGKAYTVSVGRDASFWGSVPPIRNDVHTPEDESKLYGYGFSPIVYRDHYETKDGKDGGLFVVTYSVTP